MFKVNQLTLSYLKLEEEEEEFMLRKYMMDNHESSDDIRDRQIYDEMIENGK